MTYDTKRFLLGRQKTICPRCGHRDFKPYIDMATGEPLDVNVCGRCNRVHHARWHGGATAFFLLDSEGRTYLRRIGDQLLLHAFPRLKFIGKKLVKMVNIIELFL